MPDELHSNDEDPRLTTVAEGSSERTQGFSHVNFTREEIDLQALQRRNPDAAERKARDWWRNRMD